MSHSINSIFVAIAIVAVVSVVFASHDGTTSFGVLKPGAKLIHKEEIVESKKFLRVVTRKVHFKPQPFKLSAIVITDHSESNGGTASLLEGGPPGKFAVIGFRSKRNHGLNFTLEIYSAAV
ncbi:probable salivary secreted peptide [Drosophila teissieri]|uniref:probable salivary secreted peptide n=1 Tax=Drosophila teissieri TaxID=7243 RepID=UPI001CB9FBA2|nr:probable salivary secreted peptide [Drosophila teissieri]